MCAYCHAQTLVLTLIEDKLPHVGETKYMRARRQGPQEKCFSLYSWAIKGANYKHRSIFHFEFEKSLSLRRAELSACVCALIPSTALIPFHPGRE